MHLVRSVYGAVFIDEHDLVHLLLPSTYNLAD
jgi:hypothetical protein